MDCTLTRRCCRLSFLSCDSLLPSSFARSLSHFCFPQCWLSFICRLHTPQPPALAVEGLSSLSPRIIPLTTGRHTSCCLTVPLHLSNCPALMVAPLSPFILLIVRLSRRLSSTLAFFIRVLIALARSLLSFYPACARVHRFSCLTFSHEFGRLSRPKKVTHGTRLSHRSIPRSYWSLRLCPFRLVIRWEYFTLRSVLQLSRFGCLGS